MQRSKIHSLLLLSLFCGLLIVGRLLKTSDFSGKFYLNPSPRWTFLFLIWNLFLAWIPFLLSLVPKKLFRQSGGIGLMTIWFIFWLLFFPNTLYIITDFLHLRPRSPIPFWYDILILLSFSLTGLLLGLQSLQNMLDFFINKHNSWIIRFFPYIILFLGSIGVYLGRFMRWNSWDILNNPQLIIMDTLSVFIHPIHYFDKLSLIGCLSLFFSLIFRLLYQND